MAWAVGTALMAIVLYPLSLGPMEWLGRYGYIPEAMKPVLRSFYAPLLWIARQVPLVDEFLRWCIDLWNR